MSGIIDSDWLAKHPEVSSAGRQRKIGDPFRAYGGTPGRGPSGETCWTCCNYAHNRGSEGRSKPHPKCWLMVRLWTNGPGTDIKARTPACEKWEPKIGGETKQQVQNRENYDRIMKKLSERNASQN